MKTNRILSLADSLTLFRLATAPVVVVFCLSNQYAAAFVVLCLDIVTDYMDGRVARATNTASSRGAAFDIVADCAVLFGIQTALAIRMMWPATLLYLSVVAILLFTIRLLVIGTVSKGRLGRYVGPVLYLGSSVILVQAIPGWPLRIVHGEIVTCLVIPFVAASVVENIYSILHGRRTESRDFADCGLFTGTRQAGASRRIRLP